MEIDVFAELPATPSELNAVVLAAVLRERDRCVRTILRFDDFVFEGRHVDGYGKGSYAMVNEKRSLEKLAEEIRKGE